MTGADILGQVPIAVMTAIGTWLFQGLAHRREIRKITLEHSAQVETSRDDLAIELLSSAREELRRARCDIEGLREEISTLRPLEQHFYHFQQALDHLSAVLHAKEDGAKVIAERNARAFLTRMNRIRAMKTTGAKGAS